MKLTKQKLYGLIKEALLTELFDTTDVYPFKMNETVYNKIDEQNWAFSDRPEEEMIATYEFIAQKDENAPPIPYTVKFESETDEMAIEVDFKANATWDMTNQMDLKVYSTVVAIIKHFTFNARPNLKYPFSQQTQFRAIAATEILGDSRRKRIYTYMLKKMGAQKVGSGEWNDNEIHWEVPL